MKKALILLADGLEEVEAVTPIDLLRRAGIAVTTASISNKTEVTGSHNIVIKADKLLSGIKEDFDIVILPGGGVGTENLKNSAAVLDLLKAQAASGRHIAAICAAPTVLARAGIAEGHEITSYPGTENAFDPALYRTDAVVKSGKIITSRGPGTAIDFSLEIIATMLGTTEAKAIKSQIIYK